MRVAPLFAPIPLVCLVAFGCSSSTPSGQGSGTGASTGTGTGSGSTTINGCTEATAVAAPSAGIAFGGNAGLAYTPPCVKVSVGSSLTFNGDFSAHPLTAGQSPSLTAAGGTFPTNPIKAPASGMTTSIKFTTAGTYPYYCANHFAHGMYGAVFVQ